MYATAEAYGLVFTVPANDTAVGASLVHHGEFAKPELDFLLATASGAGGAFLDVGANIGSISLPFAAKRPDWRVLAIEPHPGLHDLLRRTATQNALTNVSTLRAAAGEESTMVSFPCPSLEHAMNYGDLGFHNAAAIPRAPTQMVALDDVFDAQIRIVKIDVQGYEAQVLKGAKRLLELARPVWFIEAASDLELSAKVVRALRAAGYDVFWFYSPFVTATPNRGGPPATPGTGDPNFVAIPQGQDPVWPLPRVGADDERRPGDVAAYPYLSRYGY
jgi:FkbM family methyltransferase